MTDAPITTKDDQSATGDIQTLLALAVLLFDHGL
jgi:hypothetical protein